jgi:hypothetical protein
VGLPRGDYPSLPAVNFPDNMLSSVDVRAGCSATLYQDPGLTGPFLSVAGYRWELGSSGFSDVVSSVSITCADVALYTEAGYGLGGEVVQLPRGSYPSLEEYNFPDNDLSSVQVRGLFIG